MDLEEKNPKKVRYIYDDGTFKDYNYIPSAMKEMKRLSKETRENLKRYGEDNATDIITDELNRMGAMLDLYSHIMDITGWEDPEKQEYLNQLIEREMF